MGAMVEAVSRHGYEEVTVGELVGLAGVSKSAFYRQFANREECFLATFEEIVSRGAEEIGAAYRSREEVRDRFEAALGTLVEILTEQTAAARLVFVDSLGLGAAAVAPRERATARFEGMLRHSFAATRLEAEVPDISIRAIVGGLRELVFRCLRAEEPGRIGEHIPQLVDWALGYLNAACGDRESAGTRLVKEMAVTSPATGVADSPPDSSEHGPDWEEPANSRHSRETLSQRERIMRATAQVAARGGYRALSVAAISAAAGTSNQTFYQHFNSKEQAFLDAFDALALRALQSTATAFGEQQGWLEAGAAAISAMLRHFAADRLFRQLVFFELQTAGVVAQDRAQGMLDVFAAFLRPDPLPKVAEKRPPPVVVEAIAGGIWAAVEHQVVTGNGDSLPELAAAILDIALVPFGIE